MIIPFELLSSRRELDKNLKSLRKKIHYENKQPSFNLLQKAHSKTCHWNVASQHHVFSLHILIISKTIDLIVVLRSLCHTNIIQSICYLFINFENFPLMSSLWFLENWNQKKRQTDIFTAKYDFISETYLDKHNVSHPQNFNFHVSKNWMLIVR